MNLNPIQKQLIFCYLKLIHVYHSLSFPTTSFIVIITSLIVVVKHFSSLIEFFLDIRFIICFTKKGKGA